MAEFAWLNLGGVWFKVHGDPGSDEAKVLMKKAISDLVISKAQNVNELEVIDVDRFPYYHIKSREDKDVIELWPERIVKKKRKPLEEILKKKKEDIRPIYFIAFEAYDSTGNQIGYVVCTDGALGGYQLILSDNVVRPHPTYPFSVLHEDHTQYAPDGYSEWGEWYLAQRLLKFEDGIDLVYPFHFPDWKLGTGWADEDSHYRGFEDPDQYVWMANPYPLLTELGEEEVPYPHTINPPDKYMFAAPSLEGDSIRTYHDVSQHTKFEEKLMNWISEEYAYQEGMEGSDQAFATYIVDEYPYNPGEETQIHCEFYDPRYGDNSQIRGVRRDNTKTHAHKVGAITGVTITEQGRPVKLALEWGESAGWYTYADQWSYPWIESMRYQGDGSDVNIWTGWEYKTAIDARDWYSYPLTLHWDNFSDQLSYDPVQTEWAVLNYGEGDYSWNIDTDNTYCTIIASVAENASKYAAIIESGDYVRGWHREVTFHTACGKTFSPQLYAGQPGVDNSNCFFSGSTDTHTYDNYESYLEVNGQRLHTFASGSTGHEGGHEGVGWAFIRWWEDANWIALNVSLAERYEPNPELGHGEVSSVIYQLWDDIALTMLAEVTFNPVIPSDAFFAGAGLLSEAGYTAEGFQANWHNVPGINGPDEEPVICSGHFRCFKVLEMSDPEETTETIDLGEVNDI